MKFIRHKINTYSVCILKYLYIAITCISYSVYFACILFKKITTYRWPFCRCRSCTHNASPRLWVPLCTPPMADQKTWNSHLMAERHRIFFTYVTNYFTNVFESRGGMILIISFLNNLINDNEWNCAIYVTCIKYRRIIYTYIKFIIMIYYYDNINYYSHTINY